MKNIFYILIPLLVYVNVTYGQLIRTPLHSDPNRQGTANRNHNGAFRTASTTSSSSSQTIDTLHLPFFDDFTSLAPPIDTIFNDATATPANIVNIITYGLHGLNDGDQINIAGLHSSSFSYQGDPALIGRWYIKRINPFKFALFKDAGLTIPFDQTLLTFARADNPYWVKTNAKLSSNPDSLKWVNGGGVYINNRYCTNPPSYNVATFDGLNANGKAYVNSLAYITGRADTLTSLPIDISYIKNVNDSLVLSFYYQKGGLGEVPDNVDSLYLLFKNKHGVWDYIWGTKGSGDSGKFQQKAILFSTKDSIYFHKGFQIRFISFGELGGSYDVWNLDYILLDTSYYFFGSNNNIDQIIHPDITLQSAPSSLLKTYSAMPFQQFFFDGKNKDLVDSLKIIYLNLGTNTPPIDYDPTLIKDGISQQISIKPTSAPSFTQFVRQPLYYILNDTILKKPANQTEIKLTYSTGLPSNRNPMIRGVEYHCNDSITSYTVLKDYYAYDDSSAEWSAGINASRGKVAVRFDLNIPDTLVAVDIYFPEIEQNNTGKALDILAWSQITPTENLIATTSAYLSYTTGNNKFKRFMLANEVVLTGTVLYVGYRQGVNQYIPIGFDLNTNSNGKMFYNVNNSWAQFTDTGSLMIRPVFRNGGTVTGILNPSKPKAELECDVYPNPTTGVLNIIGDIKDVTLTDLSGKTLLERTFSSHDISKSIELQNLPSGFYFLRLSNDKASIVKKIILAK